MEHSFLIEGVLADTQSRRKDIQVLWLDLRNAFGFVPRSPVEIHETARCPSGFHRYLQGDLQMKFPGVRCSDGYTPEIPCHLGIKQGCNKNQIVNTYISEMEKKFDL